MDNVRNDLETWVNHLAAQLNVITSAKSTGDSLMGTEYYFRACNKLALSPDPEKRELSYSAVAVFNNMINNYDYIRSIVKKEK